MSRRRDHRGRRPQAGGRLHAGPRMHHVAYFDADSRIAFVGDVAGVALPGAAFVLPPTPPPDVDLEAGHQRRSHSGLASRDPVSHALRRARLAPRPLPVAARAAPRLGRARPRAASRWTATDDDAPRLLRPQGVARVAARPSRGATRPATSWRCRRGSAGRGSSAIGERGGRPAEAGHSQHRRPATRAECLSPCGRIPPWRQSPATTHLRAAGFLLSRSHVTISPPLSEVPIRCSTTPATSSRTRSSSA